MKWTQKYNTINQLDSQVIRSLQGVS